MKYCKFCGTTAAADYFQLVEPGKWGCKTCLDSTPSYRAAWSPSPEFMATLTPEARKVMEVEVKHFINVHLVPNGNAPHITIAWLLNELVELRAEVRGERV